MPFPSIDTDSIQDVLDKSMTALGWNATVTLHPEGTTFNVPVLEGFRASADATEGISQETIRVKIAAQHWDAKADRAPHKGDLIEIRGKSRRVQQRLRDRGIGGELFMYVFEVKG